ncbi:hypothetical protein CAG53_14260, partial [Vibrio sp. V26_P1S5P106]|uniref:fimbrial protein n=2 Tax=Vibrio TaxID=662 RepID=UPI001394929D
MSTKIYLLLLPLCASTSASILEFEGKVRYPTCQVMVNGIANRPIIQLPSVHINDLSKIGYVTGETSFDVTLYDCLRSMTLEQRWDVLFSPWGIDKNRESLIPGMVPAISGSAKDIGLQILENPAGQPINNEFIGDLLIGYRLKEAIIIPPGESQGSRTF